LTIKVPAAVFFEPDSIGDIALQIYIFAFMKAIKGVTEIFSDARRQEQAGQPEAAAALYQRVVDKDPGNQDAVRRLLILYRRSKDYRKELAVINAALSAIARRDKTMQQAWMTAHPEAAKAGRAILRSLGGDQVTGYGTDPMVEQLLKRKALVARRIGGPATPRRKRPASNPRQPAKPKQAAAAQKKEKAAAERRLAAERKRRLQEQKKEAEQKKAAERAAAAIRAQPSLFVILLQYLVNLDEIDAMMEQHVAFLEKYFTSGHFLVSGRQVPRTGGVILARAKDRAAVERITKQDPFVKGKLASVDIVEFKASKTGKGMGNLKRSLR
jgi:uncharacterized protein YciI